MTLSQKHKRHALILLKKAFLLRGITFEKEYICHRTMGEVLAHFNKDRKRIEEHHGEKINLRNYLGFFVFWMTKLKPLKIPVHKGIYIVDINEQIATTCAQILLSNAAASNKPQKEFARMLGSSSDRRDLMEKTFNHFMQDNGYFTLIYSLRHRNFTGDALVLYFNSIIRAATYKHVPLDP